MKRMRSSLRQCQAALVVSAGLHPHTLRTLDDGDPGSVTEA